MDRREKKENPLSLASTQPSASGLFIAYGDVPYQPGLNSELYFAESQSLPSEINTQIDTAAAARA